MIRPVQARGAPDFPVEGLAGLLARATGRTDLREVHAGLRLCVSLGQCLLFLTEERRMVGLVAWLRGPSVDFFRDATLEGLLELPRADLRHGPCLLIVEILAVAPDLAYGAVREMALWPGIDVVLGWRRGRLAELRGYRGRHRETDWSGTIARVNGSAHVANATGRA